MEYSSLGPPVEVGKKLIGLKTGYDLRGSVNYWDQVIDSEFGPLRYSDSQQKDGYIRWETADGSVTVLVDNGDGYVVEIVKH